MSSYLLSMRPVSSPLSPVFIVPASFVPYAVSSLPHLLASDRRSPCRDAPHPYCPPCAGQRDVHKFHRVVGRRVREAGCVAALRAPRFPLFAGAPRRLLIAHALFVAQTRANSIACEFSWRGRPLSSVRFLCVLCVLCVSFSSSARWLRFPVQFVHVVGRR